MNIVCMWNMNRKAILTLDIRHWSESSLTIIISIRKVLHKCSFYVLSHWIRAQHGQICGAGGWHAFSLKTSIKASLWRRERKRETHLHLFCKWAENISPSRAVSDITSTTAHINLEFHWNILFTVWHLHVCLSNRKWKMCAHGLERSYWKHLGEVEFVFECIISSVH